MPAQPPPVPAAPDARFAGLQWTFVRIRYTAWTMPPRGGFSAFDEPWYIDAPAAEWNLSRRVRTATTIQVNDPIDLTLENPELFNHPWIYIVEPGQPPAEGCGGADPARVPAARRHADVRRFPRPDRVGQHRARDEARVPRPQDHRPAEGASDFQLLLQDADGFPQTPGLGSFLQGRTWEKGGYVATLRAIEDDSGRAMVLFNWNVDMGDGWEWSNAAEYPGYVKYTAMAYRMQINEIIYSLTH